MNKPKYCCYCGGENLIEGNPPAATQSTMITLFIDNDPLPPVEIQHRYYFYSCLDCGDNMKLSYD